MGTRYFKAYQDYANVGSTRWLLITTTDLTRIYLSTGYTAMRVFNSGSNTLIWGNTSISTNSGNFLFSLASIEFENIQDNFDLHMVADSANSYVTITEFGI